MPARDVQERIKKLIVDRRPASPRSPAPTAEGLAFRTVAGHRRGEDSLRQLLDLRAAMETGLLSRLAARLPGAHLVEPESLLPRMEQEAADGADLAETDRAFHAALCRGLDNVLQSEVLEAFRDAFHRVQRDPADAPGDPRVTCGQHREVPEAVRSGDSLRAEEARR